MIKIIPIQTGLLGVNSLVVPLVQNKVLVVDPAACKISSDSGKIVDYLKKENLECIGIVLTHGHFDHITGIAEVKNAFPDAKIAIHSKDAGELSNPPGVCNQSCIDNFGLYEIVSFLQTLPTFDVLLENNDTLLKLQSNFIKEDNSLSKVLSEWKVISTPGHTPGSICLYNKEEKILISGDTVFEGSYGRTDLAGGSEVQMRKSLSFLRENIPCDVSVFPGHGAFGFNIDLV
jgi:hydroxyacylglutathione hydrolase